MLPVLSNAAAKMANAGEVSNNFDPKPVFLGRLDSGELFLDSELKLDTDGWPDGEGRGDPDWQPDKAIKQRSCSLSTLSVQLMTLVEAHAPK